MDYTANRQGAGEQQELGINRILYTYRFFFAMRLYSWISPTFKLLLKYFNAGKKNTKLQVLGGAETLSASHTTVVSAPGAHDKSAVTGMFY